MQLVEVMAMSKRARNERLKTVVFSFIDFMLVIKIILVVKVGSVLWVMKVSDGECVSFWARWMHEI